MNFNFSFHAHHRRFSTLTIHIPMEMRMKINFEMEARSTMSRVSDEFPVAISSRFHAHAHRAGRETSSTQVRLYRDFIKYLNKL